ncbi:protealysin inhibitor emfourin [Arthrobacter sp. 92]|jgi:hypothetical protein|uniref:protealysin inhibitor emfourin n=1 Tax=Arthrobacter sp. 92 TaxID=3418175 RepID=UPI003D015EBC
MKITVQRTGGVAGLTRVWSVRADTPTDKSRWAPLIDACPWDAVPARGDLKQADRFTFSIRAGRHRATIPEQAVTGPWRELVEQTRAAAEAGNPD